jgi:hypothetical protein
MSRDRCATSRGVNCKSTGETTRGFRCPECKSRILPLLIGWCGRLGGARRRHYPDCGPHYTAGAVVVTGGRHRGMHKGGFQWSGLKPLLWGEPPAFGGVGGTLPPRLSPRGGNGKGGTQIPCCRRLFFAQPTFAGNSLHPLKCRNSLFCFTLLCCPFREQMLAAH